jgi:uncharacterized membrane protein YgcG
MPLCEQTSGWWRWKKRCEQWAEDTCESCGMRVCATHMRHNEDGAPQCRGCLSDDASWDTQASSHFSGSRHARRDDVAFSDTHGASDSTTGGWDSSSDSSGGGDSSGSGGGSD